MKCFLPPCSPPSPFLTLSHSFSLFLTLLYSFSLPTICPRTKQRVRVDQSWKRISDWGRFLNGSWKKKSLKKAPTPSLIILFVSRISQGNAFGTLFVAFNFLDNKPLFYPRVIWSFVWESPLIEILASWGWLWHCWEEPFMLISVFWLSERKFPTFNNNFELDKKRDEWERLLSSYLLLLLEREREQSKHCQRDLVRLSFSERTQKNLKKAHGDCNRFLICLASLGLLAIPTLGNED